jgi:hypothetical protein
LKKNIRSKTVMFSSMRQAQFTETQGYCFAAAPYCYGTFQTHKSEFEKIFAYALQTRLIRFPARYARCQDELRLGCGF